MDSLTHIALGACLGELFLGKKIGKKAMLYGAVAASLPDIDFVASFWLSPTGDLLAHRGLTHSICFAVAFVAGAALFLSRRHRTENVSNVSWLVFLGTAITSHLFLDAFNAYGIGWFEPFNHHRFSFNILFVADPFFSLWLAIAAIVLLFGRSGIRRRSWAIFGLAGCSLYLIYACINKFRTDQQMQYAMAQNGIHNKRYFTTPCPFNNWLWYLVAETDDGFAIGYRSVFDGNQPIVFTYFARQESLLDPFSGQVQLANLKLFSEGFYTAASTEKGIVFNDLRFGQMMGWQDPEAAFVFHFYLQHAEENGLVVQRGRFANWNKKAVLVYIKRIQGIR